MQDFLNSIGYIILGMLVCVGTILSLHFLESLTGDQTLSAALVFAVIIGVTFSVYRYFSD